MEKKRVVFETDRLILREVTMEDVENLRRIFGDPEATRFFLGVKNTAQIEQWIQNCLDSYAAKGCGLWGCVLKGTGEFVGYCGLLFQKDVAGADEVEIGYGLIKDFWGQGFATEAARACRSYAHRLGYPRLISLIDPQNFASQRVAERNGMKLEKEVIRWDKRYLVYATGVM